jgi:hypothetical protein
MFDTQIADIESSGIVTKGLELLNTRSDVGSLSETDEFSSDEMHRFFLNSINIWESVITGGEAFPGKMLSPSSKNLLMSSEMLDRMVEYYNATHVQYNFRKPFGEGNKNSIIICVRMDKFGRCRIGSEKFSSVVSSCHVKSSYILAKFIMQDNQIDCYPGQIQYFFSHTVNLDDGPLEHNLAYVRWYKPASSAGIRYHFSINDDEKTCNVEL